jgi:uncharacterized membrane protein YphA (DoxX/SURF4 family)
MQRHRLTLAVRILLALVFFVTGLNKLLWFMPTPAMSQPLTAFMSALKDTGYFLPLLGSFEMLAALLLLSRRLVTLGIAVAAPIIVNILAVHSFLDPRALPIAGLLVALESYLAWHYRAALRPLFGATSGAQELGPVAARRAEAP